MSYDASGGITFTCAYPRSLTVVNAGGGVVYGTGNIQCGVSCTGTFAQGAVVTLNVVPDPYYTVTSLSGPCAGQTVSCTFTITANTTVTAVFAAQVGNLALALHSLPLVDESNNRITQPQVFVGAGIFNNLNVGVAVSGASISPIPPNFVMPIQHAYRVFDLPPGATLTFTPNRVDASSLGLQITWGGACSGNGPTCTITLDGSRTTVEVTFQDMLPGS